MSRNFRALWLTIFFCVMPFSSILAQSKDSWPRGFKAPASRGQLAQCHYKALTRRLVVDSTQATVIRNAIEVSIDTTGGAKSRNRRVWDARVAVRDSVILGVLRSKADSARFVQNSRSEMDWFYSGACNG